jgi:hypothetical protein
MQDLYADAEKAFHLCRAKLAETLDTEDCVIQATLDFKQAKLRYAILKAFSLIGASQEAAMHVTVDSLLKALQKLNQTDENCNASKLLEEAISSHSKDLVAFSILISASIQAEIRILEEQADQDYATYMSENPDYLKYFSVENWERCSEQCKRYQEAYNKSSEFGEKIKTLREKLKELGVSP